MSFGSQACNAANFSFGTNSSHEITGPGFGRIEVAQNIWSRFAVDQEESSTAAPWGAGIGLFRTYTSASSPKPAAIYAIWSCVPQRSMFQEKRGMSPNTFSFQSTHHSRPHKSLATGKVNGGLQKIYPLTSSTRLSVMRCFSSGMRPG